MDAGETALAPEARLLHAAKGCLGSADGPLIDTHEPAFELFCDSPSARQVSCASITCKAKGSVVGHAHHVLLTLQQALADGERKTGAWFARHRMAVVPFADLPDAFVNLNSPSDLAAWEARLREGGAP